jgi:hypothetical protein
MYKHFKNGKTILDNWVFWKWQATGKLKKISNSTGSGE